ncbi:hypothetical protein DFH06DRAFT_1317346 [Mycena polygramma]|nr:hypothetical protein DFH06DRAFT_1317346 [Mycena polygramma]
MTHHLHVLFRECLLHLGPAVAAGLTFVDYLVEAGDFQGKNADTEARLVCAWTNGTIQTFTTDVATSLGATPA